MKKVYVIQPYAVGSKGSKSLVLLIPAPVVKQCDINTSTAFTLKPDTDTKKVTICQAIFSGSNEYQKQIETPTGERLQTYQPVDEEVH